MGYFNLFFWDLDRFKIIKKYYIKELNKKINKCDLKLVKVN